jgi:hypothetical protein
MARIGRDSVEKIETHWVGFVTRSEIDDIVGAMRRYVVEELFGEISVNINESNSTSCSDVLNE